MPLIIVHTPASIGRDIRDSFPSRVGCRLFQNQTACALPKLKAPPEESPLNYTKAKLVREEAEVVTHQTAFFGILSGGQYVVPTEAVYFQTNESKHHSCKIRQFPQSRLGYH